MLKISQKKRNRTVNSANNSPPKKSLKLKLKLPPRQSETMVFGHGPNLTEGNATVDKKSLLDQIQNINILTDGIIQELTSPAAKHAFQQMSLIAQSCAFFLRQDFDLKKKLEDERAAHCIVVSGLPESTSPSATGRADEDRKKVLEIMDVLEVECLPTAVYRMGNSTSLSNDQTPRLLKIELPTRKLAAAFQKNRGKLKSHPNFNKIYVRGSLSPDQLQHRKEMEFKRNQANIGLNDDDKFVLWGPPDKLELKAKKNLPGRK
jgi:hypothetical protein